MTDDRLCDNCQSYGMTTFYDVADVPIQSNLLLANQTDALAHPRGNLQLGFCSACGFIANLQYDAAWLEYTSDYEDSQGFSARFQDFIQRLADRLIRRYELRQKDILEIGCGRGDFLALLCERGNNRGIGIDPSYNRERARHDDVSNVRFIKDYFSATYTHLPADFICCRHTLEHLPHTAAFMHMLREAIGDRSEVVVFFEVPDTGRILQECAFWDIYYEHCSYFSPTSLIYLFQACGFEVLDFNKDFDNQYLLIEARPAAAPNPALPHPDEVHVLAQDIASFQRRYQDHIRHWHQRLQQFRSETKRIAIWGAGSKAVGYLTALRLGDTIDDVVDINPYKQDMYLPGSGHRIVAPAMLQDDPPDVVIVMNPIYRDEIRQHLQQLGIDAQCIAVS